MKLILLAFALFLTVKDGFCQEKVNKFCEVVIKQQTFGSNYKVDRVKYGQTNKLITYKDAAVSPVLDSIMKFRPFSSSIVIIDYMNKNHWSVVTSYAVLANSATNSSYTHLIFKREFDSSDITDQH